MRIGLVMRNKDSIRESLWGTTDRKLNIISLFLGIFSLGLTVLVWKYPEPIPKIIIVRDQVIVFGLITIIMALMTQHVRRGFSLNGHRQKIKELEAAIEENHKALLEQLNLTYGIAHQGLNIVFAHIENEILTYEIGKSDLKIIEKICHIVTDKTKDLFLSYFQSRGTDIENDISISVKLIMPTEKLMQLKHLNEQQKVQIVKKDIWVVTVYRDPYTHTHFPERETVGKGNMKLHDLSRNTAFQNIIENGNSFFLCNDLQAVATTYNNENPKWREQYNSTLVVPIRCHDNDTDRLLNFGFLAIDSMNKGRLPLFNDVECRHMLNHAADILAFSLLALDRVKSVDRKQE